MTAHVMAFVFWEAYVFSIIDCLEKRQNGKA